MSSANPYEHLPKLLQGLAGAALAVLVLWALALFLGNKEANQVLPGSEAARAVSRYEIKAEIDKAALALHKTTWIDKEKGTVHLPIERAMELAVTELAAKEARATNVTVAWTPPQMPDYNAKAKAIDAATAAAPAAAAPAAANAAPAPAVPAAPVSAAPATPTAPVQAPPAASVAP